MSDRSRSVSTACGYRHCCTLEVASTCALRLLCCATGAAKDDRTEEGKLNQVLLDPTIRPSTTLLAMHLACRTACNREALLSVCQLFQRVHVRVMQAVGVRESYVLFRPSGGRQKSHSNPAFGAFWQELRRSINWSIRVHVDSGLAHDT